MNNLWKIIMAQTPLRVKNIVNFERYLENPSNYSHLFKVQLPPEDINLWKIRYNVEIGTPLIGDLFLSLEEEKKLEIHPFPEWVVHLRSKDLVKSKPYLIVPNLSRAFLKKLNRKSLNDKIELIKNEIEKVKIEDLIAFEYELGINILVPAFVPHFFISSRINKEMGDTPPYLQVFEPNIENITKVLKIKPTYYFELPFTVII